MLLKNSILGFAILLLIGSIIYAEENTTKKIENLNGYWKFSIGDNKEWVNPNFDDSYWETIKVPSRWENKGYHGYDGIAWYRISFSISSKYINENLFLSLGFIDDVAEIYINGILIGTSGSFPPKYKSAFNEKIWISIPKKILTKEKNIIAVRVYDDEQAGGIYRGDLGIFIFETPLDLIYDLSDKWKFKTGDNPKWSEFNFDDKKWDEIFVPSHWDVQGYSNYDGFAWYRISFNINPDRDIMEDELVILLGKIDDLDETYLNGKFIGSTGDMIISPLDGSIDGKNNRDFNTFRGYKIKIDDLRNGKNVIAVRVFDGLKNGGIYQGPIGIATYEDYIHFRTKNKIKKKSFLDKLFE